MKLNNYHLSKIFDIPGSPFPKTFKQLERDLSENLRRLGHLSCHAQ